MECKSGPDYNAASLAHAAGVAPTYVARLCRAGRIPAVKVADTIWVISYEDGQAWLAKRKKKKRDKTEP